MGLGQHAVGMVGIRRVKNHRIAKAVAVGKPPKIVGRSWAGDFVRFVENIIGQVDLLPKYALAIGQIGNTVALLQVEAGDGPDQVAIVAQHAGENRFALGPGQFQARMTI